MLSKTGSKRTLKNRIVMGVIHEPIVVICGFVLNYLLLLL